VPSARELLDQADALMRRNRPGVIDTEIPELTEMVAMVAPASAAPPAVAAASAPAVLDDVPELTEAVEEIEIESIVELPEDLDESSGWLHHDHGELSVVGRGPDSVQARLDGMSPAAANVERGRAPLAVVGKLAEAIPAPPVVAPVVIAKPVEPIPAPPVVVPVVIAKQVEPIPTPTPALASATDATPWAPQNAASAAADSLPATPDDWARWEVLADEIRMQVLQRIDIFTDTRLRDQLSEQLQPIVDRASAEMVATINAHVGGLLRAYIAEAIEREIEKWRGAPR
jgi:hypothetical protein